MSDQVLIISSHDDLHALSIVWAAQQLEGAMCRILAFHEAPSLASTSIHLGEAGQEITWNDSTSNDTIRLSAFDKIWLRKIAKNKIPDYLHPEDRPFARGSWSQFLDYISKSRLDPGVWINDPHTAEYSDTKNNQLLHAAQSGLKIPATLIGNDPQDIRTFFDQHANEGVIIKPLQPFEWKDGDDYLVPFTTTINREDLEDDETLMSSPMIYQSCIQKQYELRILVAGDNLEVGKLDTQSQERSVIDSRLGNDMATGFVTHYELPNHLKDRLLHFCRCMGLGTGVIDMARGLDGEYYFFEVNPSGQYLWLDACSKDVCTLGAMVKYLFPNHHRQIENSDLSFARFVESGFHIDYAERLDGKIIPHFVNPN